MFKKIPTILFLFALGLVTQACYSGNPSKGAESKATRVHSPGKPGASVNIRNPQPIKFDSPGMQDFELVLQVPGTPDEISMHLSSSDGVDLLSPIGLITFPVAAEGEYRLPLSLNTKREGRHYVHLHVDLLTNGNAERRVVSAIIQVGRTGAKLQKAAPESHSDGVITLPAQERVSPGN